LFAENVREPEKFTGKNRGAHVDKPAGYSADGIFPCNTGVPSRQSGKKSCENSFGIILQFI
jgi:hypothetical protein